MSAADRLNEIEARANAATEGPWAVVVDDGVILALVLTDEDDGLMFGDNGYDAPITTETGEDAEFIAHARTDVPALVAALRAVHQIAFDPDTISALEHGAIEFGPNLHEGVSDGDALGYARDALRDIRRAIEEALS